MDSGGSWHRKIMAAISTAPYLQSFLLCSYHYVALLLLPAVDTMLKNRVGPNSGILHKSE